MGSSTPPRTAPIMKSTAGTSATITKDVYTRSRDSDALSSASIWDQMSSAMYAAQRMAAPTEGTRTRAQYGRGQQGVDPNVATAELGNVETRPGLPDAAFPSGNMLSLNPVRDCTSLCRCHREQSFRRPVSRLSMRASEAKYCAIQRRCRCR